MRAVAGRRPPLQIRQLVLQPTPFCNIDCRYCYLSTRHDRRRMSPEVLRTACRRVFDSPFVGSSIEIVWHAGEPLVLPITYYDEAFAVVRSEAFPGCRVEHAIQTNGLLIDDRWCDFFLNHRVRLGLSIDGPAWLHDRQRVTRLGRRTHDRAMEAVQTLNRRGVPFSVIAVLTAEALRQPDEMFAFFEGLGTLSVGFNIEETEADHVSPTLADPELIGLYAAFMRRMLELQKHGSLKIRELEAAQRGILRASNEPRSTEASPLAILSVDVEGNFATFSPELLGVEVREVGRFLFGNVLRNQVVDMLDDPRFQTTAGEIAAGVDTCRATCEFFGVCGGGAPVNKLFENGSFASGATRHCTTKIQVNTLLLLDDLEARSTAKLPYRRRVADRFQTRGDPIASDAEASIPTTPAAAAGAL